jgi:hypothetical protein
MDWKTARKRAASSILQTPGRIGSGMIGDYVGDFQGRIPRTLTRNPHVLPGKFLSVPHKSFVSMEPVSHTTLVP